MRGFSMRVPYMKALCWPRNAPQNNHRLWIQDPVASWEKPLLSSFSSSSIHVVLPLRRIRIRSP